MRCKRVRLSVAAQHPQKESDMAACSRYPSRGECRQGDPWSLLTNESNQIHERQVQGETPSQINSLINY